MIALTAVAAGNATRVGIVTKLSPLNDVHEALEANFTDFAGWQMPVRYSSDLAEHHAVRKQAGLFDLSHMGQIAVSGADADRYLDYALAGKLSAVKVGRARYTVLCNSGGGVLDDLVVYRMADDEYLIVANAANTDVVLTALSERVAGFDALVEDASDDYALIAVQGPASVDIMRAVGSKADLDGLKYYAWTPDTVDGVDLLLARTGYTGEDGFELYVDPAHAAQIWHALTAAGAPLGLQPAGLACRDTLRLEAGMALYGHELTAETTPFEAGLGRIVRLEKDFVGRDALAAKQEPARVLVGLMADGKRAPRAGYAVLADGEPVGQVTSGALSPTLGHPIAMAYVSAQHSTVGTKLAVDVRGKQLDVEVVELPFYQRPSRAK